MATSKKNIREFGKIFQYLKDPELRKKEIGDALLTIEGAEISGESFQYVDWSHILFKNCDFVGAYQIKIGNSTDVRYEDCRFSGIFGYGKTNRVHFLRCAWTDGSIGYAGEKSTALVFESCRFVGTNPDRNHWGGVGSDGEAEFIGCTAKYFVIEGHAKLTLRQCEFEDMKCTPRSKESGGVFADVLIEGCKLRGDFSMVPADFQSLTIRDSTFGTLDLSKATLKGEILMERVNAEKMNLAVASGKAINLSGVKISGSGQKVFYLAVNRVTSVLLNDCVLPSAPDSEAPWLGGAEQEPAYKSRPPVSQSVMLKNLKASRIDATYLNTARLLVDGGNFQEVDMRNGRIGSLEISNTSIASTLNLGSSVIDSLMLSSVAFSKTLNLSNTQIKEFKQVGGTDISKLGRNLNKEGSNIKLPR
ncbi:hypothetical protein BKP43_08200 [Variovorax boronicumulans]|uniref:hypothetical protein n=1 Tax=Variovorax boronicumulans TaxID=436515 RepID=UPI000BB2D869|nr:hypothetical protein [Variovorax boronicumulans]PBI95020.1 hypothetical protein BKP43_08200 [Variovorax boronicumulans]